MSEGCYTILLLVLEHSHVLLDVDVEMKELVVSADTLRQLFADLKDKI